MTKAELIKALEEYPDDIEICGINYTSYPDIETDYFRITKLEMKDYIDIVESSAKLNYLGYTESKVNEKVIILI